MTKFFRSKNPIIERMNYALLVCPLINFKEIHLNWAQERIEAGKANFSAVASCSLSLLFHAPCNLFIKLFLEKNGTMRALGRNNPLCDSSRRTQQRHSRARAQFSRDHHWHAGSRRGSVMACRVNGSVNGTLDSFATYVEKHGIYLFAGAPGSAETRARAESR